jgi:hypothetical protein
MGEQRLSAHRVLGKAEAKLDPPNTGRKLLHRNACAFHDARRTLGGDLQQNQPLV